MNPYSVLNRIKAEIGAAVCMFSTGKDSIAALDLLLSNGIKCVPIYCYFVEGLEIRERLLRFYEKRYKIKILRFPHWELPEIYAERGVGKKSDRVTQRDFEEFLRAETDMRWISWGYRKNESLERRGMLTRNEIDYKNGRIFPIADWTQKHVLSYLQNNKLPLPVDYAAGFRDVNTWKGSALLWLYRNHRADYDKVVRQFPWTEGELVRAIENE